MSFLVQKPKKQVYEPHPSEVAHWLAANYPTVQARAKRKRVEICWRDETGLQTDSQHARRFALKGQAPLLRLKINR